MEGSKTINIEYQPAIFHRRIMANFLDLLIFVVIMVFSFIACRAIVASTPYYQEGDRVIYQARKESGLYVQSTDTQLMDVVSFCNSSLELSSKEKKHRMRYAIEDFIVYVTSEAGVTKGEEVSNEYNTKRLDESMVYESVPMFVIKFSETLQRNTILENSECSAPDSEYMRKFYIPFIDQYCQGYLITLIPDYYAYTKYQSDMFLYAELLPAFLFSGLLTYFVPILIFKRGRMTIGKLVYKISVVDSKFLSPKIGRTLARQSIYFFGEILLSLFTFAIPAIMSFSMMAFSKKKQGFADYMLGLRDIDTTEAKVFFNLDEAMISELKANKKPIDFKAREDI